MSFYADEFLSAKPGVFEKKEFNVGTDKSLETEVYESLNAFGIKGEVKGSESGPYITRVYFKLAPGVRFNSIEPLTDDLKMSLGTPSIKIMPDPERGAVAIEIPNAKRKNIPFGNVFHANHSGLVLPAALGVDPKGSPIYLDIADTPHLLIAGTTGSGKSVCLNSIITSLALNCRPIDLQFLLIDPKGTEFVQYEGVKNLISGRIIDDVEAALKSLAWLVEEMERRYKILKRCKCRSINEYKHKRKFGLNDGTSTCFVEDMPYIVVVIDEYADLMMNSANALQEDVKKLGQKARAAGIHLVLATQRPSTKIIDGDIKTNFPTRIALKVSSITDSKTILDYGGAERLLGKGDMLLKRQEDLQRVHGCFISDDEINKAIELLPQKKLYRINEEDVFEYNIHDLHAQEDLKKHATWVELNGVSKIILENFSEFMEGERDTIYQVCASQFGMDKSRVDVVCCDVSGAIGDTVFFQVLQYYCSEKGKNWDYPFVKAVIYSSPLRWKYKDGRYLFTDYILEQAFEKDDAAAMASVHFFCNDKTFHLDYLKKKLDALLENGNEKVKDYLAEIKNKVVEELENEYCDDMENYPNRDLFDRLLAEAYPPLMNFLLESGNTRYIIEAAEKGVKEAKKFVYAHLDIEEIAQIVIEDDKKGDADAWNYITENVGVFSDYIMEKADKADVDAWKIIENNVANTYDEVESSFHEYVESCVYRDSELYGEKRNCSNEVKSLAQKVVFENPNTFSDIVLELARKGNERARNVVYGAIWENDSFCEFVLDDAQEGNSKSQNVVYKNPGISRFQQYILDAAKLGDDDAIEAVYSYPYDNNFRDFILKQAEDGDCNAKKIVLERPEIVPFQEYLCELVSSSDEEAKAVVLANVKYDLFQKCIVELALHGDCDAKKVALEKPEIVPFQEYLCKLVLSSDEEAKKVVLENPEIWRFQQHILNAAKLGDDDAKKVVLERPEIDPFREYLCKLVESSDEDAKNVVLANVKYDLFRKCIVKLAFHGDYDAKKVVLENYEIELFQECVCKLALNGDAGAKKVVPANVRYDLFRKCIVKLASHGDCDAKKVVLENYEIELFQECVCKLALNGDVGAKKVVQINYEKYESFQECMVNCALQGDDCFADIIYDTIEKLQKKNDSTIAKNFRSFIIFEARENVDRALKCVETDPQNEEYKGLLIEKCLKKDEWALTIICNNLGCYGSWINETIKSQYNKNDLKELLIEKILHLAKFDDYALKYIVCENPQEKKFKNLIVEKIQQNKDVFECIYRYCWRETSSCFSEFVKQRISKEFGIRYECDGNTLKEAVESLQIDSNKYFVLAAALDGNELALTTVRKAFLGFSRIIIESLTSGTSQDRKYIVECVNSDTVGKLIRGLASNGNGEAVKILQKVKYFQK